MRVQLESNLRELARARRLARDAAEVLTDSAIGEEKIEQLELAVTEAVANVIRHSYDNEHGHKFEFIIEKVPEGIEVIIRHTGKSFDPAAIQEPVFDGSGESGFGLYIISKCVDFFDYSTDMQNRTTIRLLKKIREKEGTK